MENFNEEKIPHSLTLEQAVLAVVMADPVGWDEVSDILEENDLFSAPHRIIFRAIKSLYTKNKPVDAFLVAEWLKLNGLHEKAGGDEMLSRVIMDCPTTTDNVKHHAERIREFSIERKLLAVTEKIKTGILVKEGKTTLEILESAESDILSIANKNSSFGAGVELFGAKELFADALNRMDIASRLDDGELIGINTGLKKVNEYTDGFQKQDLIYIGARPSMGKTTLALNFSESALFGQDLPVVIFSMESPKHQMTQRLMASRANVSYQKVIRGKFENNEFNRVNSAMADIKKRKLIMCDRGGLSPNEMRTALKTVVREHGGVGFIMADYVQKMKLKGNHKLNRNDELSEISGDLKRIAMEFNCPFICLSQLSKACETRPDKRPMMSDLRDCGSLEADADAVIMLYREERYYPLKVESKGIAELIFCKNRNGQVGTVYTRFDGATFRFSDIQHGDYDEE